LAPLQGQKADIILANPPYVDATDMASLPAEYHHEPRLALAAGDNGLDLVHRLLVQAADILTPNGLLILEVGNSWLALERAYPDQVFIWLTPEVGGHGLCVLYGSDLIAMKHRAEEWVQQL
jgi:ribosomal protein L3 glutamine methyltransferase